MLLQGAFIAVWAAITDIRRFGKFRANIPFIKNTGGRTFAAGPAKPVFERAAFQTYFLSGALMLKGLEAIIEGSAIGSASFERDVIFYLFGDGGAILV